MAAKRRKPSSYIDPNAIRMMEEQQRLADEARAREQAFIEQQTKQQQDAYNNMLSVYQQQIAALQNARAEQQRYIDELMKQQEEQNKAVEEQRAREEQLARMQEAERIQQATRAYSIFDERRKLANQRRATIFGNVLPPGYTLYRGILG
ncbi:hypothetical protein [Cyanophage BHS3]|nr:hypothetical protein [Cyanophage BHS3]